MVIPVTDTQSDWTTAKCLSNAGTRGFRRSRQSIDAERYSGTGRSSDARRWRDENERALALLRGGPPRARARWCDGPPLRSPGLPPEARASLGSPISTTRAHLGYGNTAKSRRLVSACPRPRLAAALLSWLTAGSEGDRQYRARPMTPGGSACSCSRHPSTSTSLRAIRTGKPKPSNATSPAQASTRSFCLRLPDS